MHSIKRVGGSGVAGGGGGGGRGGACRFICTQSINQYTIRFVTYKANRLIYHFLTADTNTVYSM